MVDKVKIFSQKDECMYEVLNEFICETFPRMSVTFRDESNESSSIMIGYNDAIVTALNHPLIVRSKASLVRATATVPQLWR